MPRLEKLSWNQLVDELRQLASDKPSAGEAYDPAVVLHDLFVHQVELEMQNRELRDAQQQLEASRARYADLYDFAPVGCLAIDADACVQEINLTGAALLGRDRAMVLGRPLLGLLGLRDKTKVLHDHVRRCMDERCRVDDELEIFPRGRPPMFVHMTSAPLLDADGKAVGCRVALTDVTDRRRAERAEADAQMKEEFLGTVSHELRTPLAAIMGWSHLLRRRDRAEEIDRGVLYHGLDVIARNAALQSRLIEDLLDVSRILAGKLRVDLKPLDLEPLVRAAVDTLGPAAQAKGVALSAAVAPGRFVLGDAERLTQVVTNLLGNALKFTPAGGKIEVETMGDEKHVRLVVRDTGRGIARQDLPHVFERFKQVDTSTTRAAGGLGLGLAIVDHIVRAHGGDVSAWSPGLGLGATFTVRLRSATRTGEESKPAPARPAQESDSLEGCDILCVDDDADALEAMTLVLEERGAAVRTARSAAEAMTALGASTPDVVVSDIGLPVQDGYALVHRIRTLPGDAAHVPAIALTAYGGAASEQHALEAGFQGFLCKPVRPEVLVRAVASVVGR